MHITSLSEYARDYQDLSACAYLRSRRFRDQEHVDWLTRSAQEDASELALKARAYLYTLLRLPLGEIVPYNKDGTGRASRVGDVGGRANG